VFVPLERSLGALVASFPVDLVRAAEEARDALVLGVGAEKNADHPVCRPLSTVVQIFAPVCRRGTARNRRGTARNGPNRKFVGS
jgi:hypothetical protein